MKNNTSIIKKIFAFAFVLALLMTAFSVVALADNGIQLKDFNGNEIVRQIVSYLGGIVCIVGTIVGGVTIVMGRITDDPKLFPKGFLTIVICHGVGGVMLLIVNMMLV